AKRCNEGEEALERMQDAVEPVDQAASGGLLSRRPADGPADLAVHEYSPSLPRASRRGASARSACESLLRWTGRPLPRHQSEPHRPRVAAEARRSAKRDRERGRDHIMRRTRPAPAAYLPAAFSASAKIGRAHV